MSERPPLIDFHVGILMVVPSSVTICIYVDGGRCTAVTVDLVAQLGWEAEEGRLLLVELGAGALSVTAW